MKKFIGLILSLIFIFTLFSCDQAPVPKTSESVTQVPVPTEIVKKLKVFSLFVNDNLSIYDDGKLSFLHLSKSLIYNDPAIEDSLSDNKNTIISDSFSLSQDTFSTGSGLSIKGGASGDHFKISEEYHLYDNGRTVNSARFFITYYVSGMTLPFDITFETNIDEALKMITDLDISFKPDEGSDTDMTLYSNGNELIIYSNLNAIKAPIDYLNPYRIIYTNKYIYTNKNGFEAERTEKVSLNFDTFNKTLSEVIIEVKDGYTIQVSQIPQTLPTPNITPEETCDGCDGSQNEEDDNFSGGLLFGKPVIYLYPKSPTDVNVALDVTGDLIFTYPQYNNGWSVTAYPDGTLIDRATGKEYSYLFWESQTNIDFDLTEGFVVKGEDTADFLQETLAKIGLTPREYNEMIVYWLPKMQNNKYNLITFQTETYTDNAKLYIDPKPDSLLRVFMAFKALEEPIEVTEPTFEAFERRGFTVVEWGGTEIKS